MKLWEFLCTLYLTILFSEIQSIAIIESTTDEWRLQVWNSMTISNEWLSISNGWTITFNMLHYSIINNCFVLIYLGLRIQKSCTRLSNTVCEPLKGFFCMVREKGSCKFAVKHSQCKPGEYIQQRGTGVLIFGVDVTKASAQICKCCSHILE